MTNCTLVFCVFAMFTIAAGEPVPNSSAEHLPKQRTLDLLIFTQYCGPGHRPYPPIFQPPLYKKIDLCCKQHDNCENTIEGKDDYKKYPGLPFKFELYTK